MKRVKAKGVHAMVNEPTLDAPEFFGSEVTHDLEAFRACCNVIVPNRWNDEFADVADEVCTRDLFKRGQGRGSRLGWAGLTYKKIGLPGDGGASASANAPPSSLSTPITIPFITSKRELSSIGRQNDFNLKKLFNRRLVEH